MLSGQCTRDARKRRGLERSERPRSCAVRKAEKGKGSRTASPIIDLVMRAWNRFFLSFLPSFLVLSHGNHRAGSRELYRSPSRSPELESMPSAFVEHGICTTLSLLCINFVFRRSLLCVLIFSTFLVSLQGTAKASRAQILKKAAEYIQMMRRKNTSHHRTSTTSRNKTKYSRSRVSLFLPCRMTQDALSFSVNVVGLSDRLNQ